MAGQSWYQANRERAREYQRQWYEANREAKNEKSRQWAAAHPEKMREYNRRYREANLEKERARQRRSREANREANRESQRRYRAKRGTDGRRVQAWALNHGLRPEDWATLWDGQDGRCYLCGEPMTPEQVHIDHDHRCCPKDHSCIYCRRGLAHASCNQLIGFADDDPGRLRRVADNLEAALKVTDARLAGKPEQMTMEILVAAYDQAGAAAAVEALAAPGRLRAVG
jgi:hypothetical protein